MLLLSAFKDLNTAIQITHKTDGGKINAQRLKAKTKVTRSRFHDFLDPDYCSIVNSKHAWNKDQRSLEILTP